MAGSSRGNKFWIVPPLDDSLPSVLFGAHFMNDAGEQGQGGKDQGPATTKANAMCSTNMVITATKPIQTGEEILLNYKGDAI